MPPWPDWDGAELVASVVLVVVVVVVVVGCDVEAVDVEADKVVDEPVDAVVADELDDDWADSSSDSFASAADKVVWADVTSFCRDVGLSDARVCPAVTC